MTPARRPALKEGLERLYHEFNRANSARDPVDIVRRFGDPADREIVAFCAASLAFGRVASVLQSIERLVAAMHPGPAAFARAFDPSRDGGALKLLGHRWTRGADLVALIWVLRQMLERSGSIERFFAEGDDPQATDVGPGLEAFSTRALAMDLRPAYGRVPHRPGVCYFFPRPSGGSGCKRLNLFLRWMARSDSIDPGGWSLVAPSRLIVPLDTHVVRIGRCLRLTGYRTPGWKMAVEITSALRALDPVDPVKYDFSLCHLGMTSACGFNRTAQDANCPLRGVCRPRSGRRGASRAPSGRH